MARRRMILPPPALQPLVQVFWVLDEHHEQAERHAFLPEQTGHLTFYSGHSWVQRAGGLLTPMPQAVLEGLITEPAHLYSEGPLRALRAELYPWTARQLFGWSYPAPALDLLSGAAGPEAVRVSRAVASALTARDDEAALGLLQEWLLALAAGEAGAGSTGGGWQPGVGVRAAAALYHSTGQRRVAELAGALDVSPRTLERQFLQEVGIGAKTLARLIRFETAHNALSFDPQTPLASLAYDLGFSDQAHLTREFRALGGLTPGSFARLAEARRDATDWADDWAEVRELNPRLLLPHIPE